MKEDWIYKRGDLYYANLNPFICFVIFLLHLNCLKIF